MRVLPLAPSIVEAGAPSSIQPGGGVCVDLEARWGRLRRGVLRRFRPGYVARMARVRQGACEGCAHDVVDARDLKLVRNVCGFSFREEDDPFRWRGRLGLARAGLAEVAVSSIACGTVALFLGFAIVVTRSWWLALPIVAVAAFWVESVRFFRDPARTIPVDPDALVAPSDGIVTHLGEVDAPGFPGERAFRVSIYLSPWDVHLNRVPRPGRVVAVRYFRGAFVKAIREDAVARNEQLWTDFVEAGGRLVRVKQISGALARRLVCWAKIGEEFAAGDRYGMIKYGSRSDVLVPRGESMEMRVAIGDRVFAGSSVLLRFRNGTDRNG